MPHHELRPLRKRSPWIGSRPGVFVALPPRRPRPALLVAAATALLPRPLPPQPQITRPRRPTPPPAAAQRRPRVVVRSTPAILLNRGGQVLLTPPHRPTVPLQPGLKRALVISRNSPAILFNRGGSIFTAPVHRPTQLLTAGQTAPDVLRRDQRLSAGRVSLSRPPASPTAAPVDGSLRTVRVYGGRGRLYLPIVPGTGAAVVTTPSAVGTRAVRLVLPRPPRPPGQVFLSRIPARTVRLAPFQTDALLVRRDERGFVGRVLLTHVPARTVRLTPPQTTALVRLQPAPEPHRGVVLLAGPHRDTSPRPAKRPLVVSPVRPPLGGAVWQNRSLPRTVRLASYQVEATIARRDERRFAGSVSLSGPHRPNPVVTVVRPKPPLLARRDEPRGGWETVRGLAIVTHPQRLTPPFVPPRTVIGRRDERRYAGSVWLSGPHRPTLILTAGETEASVVRRDQRGFGGAALFVGPHRSTFRLTAGQTRALVVRRDERRYPGAVWTNRVPARTIRLNALQTTARVLRRDERSFAGAVRLLPPRRPNPIITILRPKLAAVIRREEPRGGWETSRGLVVVTHPQRLTPPFIPPAAKVVRRDERHGAGAVLLVPPPHRTVRLTPPQTTARVVPPTPPLLVSLRAGAVRLVTPPRTAAVVVTPSPARLGRIQAAGRPEPKRGAVFLSRVPARTVRLAPFQTTARLIRRDQRGFGGSVLFTTPHRPTTTAPAAQRAVLVVRRDERRGNGRALVLAPRRPTLRLTPNQLKAAVAQRVFPRPGGTPGAVLFVRPVRPRVVPRLPRHLIVRRDDRRGRPAVLTSPPGRFNAIVVTHGNPRAGVTKRAGAAAVLVQRGKPAAVLTLRRPSGTLIFEEG